MLNWSEFPGFIPDASQNPKFQNEIRAIASGTAPSAIAQRAARSDRIYVIWTLPTEYCFTIAPDDEALPAFLPLPRAEIIPQKIVFL